MLSYNTHFESTHESAQTDDMTRAKSGDGLVAMGNVNILKKDE